MPPIGSMLIYTSNSIRSKGYMKKDGILLIIFVLLLFVSSCNTNESIEEPIEGVTKGFWTSTYTTGDENSTIKVEINNFDKTGSVEMRMFIADEDEWGYSFAEGTYTRDDFFKEEDNETIDLSGLFPLDFTCEFFWAVFRDYDTAMEEFSNWTNTSEWSNQTLTDEETKEQKKMEEFMKGFKATKFSLKFVDKEDKSTILECYSTGLEQEDLGYRVYGTTSEREMELGEESFWGGSSVISVDVSSTDDIEQERTEYASCVSLGCDNKHIAIGDRSTSEWYYCDCFGVESIAREDRTCFSSIDVAEAVGYYKAWDCE